MLGFPKHQHIAKEIATGRHCTQDLFSLVGFRNKYQFATKPQQGSAGIAPMPSPVLQEGATAPILLPLPGHALQTPSPSGLFHFSTSLPTTSLPPGDAGVRSDSSKALLSLLSSVKKAKRQDGGGGEASPVIPFGTEAAVPSQGTSWGHSRMPALPCHRSHMGAGQGGVHLPPLAPDPGAPPHRGSQPSVITALIICKDLNYPE